MSLPLHRYSKFVFVFLLNGFLSLQTMADELILPPDDLDLVGELRVTEARHEDTLLDIARRHDLGKNEIVAANPHVDVWLPGTGTRVLLPTRFILPNAPRSGLILNLPEMRMYYFPPMGKNEQRRLITHPVSIGRMDWKTPLGETRVVSKQRDPAWRPPKSIIEEAAGEGREIPKLVPAGPDNPLGGFAMRLGLPGYLIHSTNKPFGVGMRVTHGCIRMYPEDIEGLFEQISLKTPVHILNQPVKLGWLADTLFIEVHPPLEEDQVSTGQLLRMALELVHTERERRPFLLNGSALNEAVRNQTGVPTVISMESPE